MFEPDIYRIECEKTKRAFFGKNLVVESGKQEVLKELADGTCENQQMLEDSKTYGPESFKGVIHCSAQQFYDPNLLKAALEEAKKCWPGELY